jgi:hypothetical protein
VIWGKLEEESEVAETGNDLGVVLVLSGAVLVLEGRWSVSVRALEDEYEWEWEVRNSKSG